MLERYWKRVAVALVVSTQVFVARGALVSVALQAATQVATTAATAAVVRDANQQRELALMKAAQNEAAVHVAALSCKRRPPSQSIVLQSALLAVNHTGALDPKEALLAVLQYGNEMGGVSKDAAVKKN